MKETSNKLRAAAPLPSRGGAGVGSVISLLLLLTLGTSAVAQGAEMESAQEAVKNMGLGWNLGNTLDSNSNDTLNMWIERWTSRLPKDYETAWGQPVTKPALMKMMKEAGFNAIRVPVTWYPHMEAKFRFTGNSTAWSPSKDDIGTKINAAWMKRVHEVVDYVISNGMYCILNIHHDTGAHPASWLIADEASYAQQHERFEAVWRQIANEFKNYGDHLLFEGYNEMLDVKRSWCFASFNADGQYDAAIATSAYNAINAYAQSFVDVVRSTGGNNAQRNLIVTTYGACCGAGSWNSHLQDPLKKMKLPEDEAVDHLLFEVHSYPDITNLSYAKTELRTTLNNLNKNLASKGAPIIIGEWGTLGENDYEEHRANYLAFSRYFVEQAKQRGFATFHWMGLSDGEARSVPEFNQPDRLEAIIKGYYGEEGYINGITPQTTKLLNDQLPNDAIYTLSGQKVRDVRSKGIYIQKGRKILH